MQELIDDFTSLYQDIKNPLVIDYDQLINKYKQYLELFSNEHIALGNRNNMQYLNPEYLCRVVSGFRYYHQLCFENEIIDFYQLQNYMIEKSQELQQLNGVISDISSEIYIQSCYCGEQLKGNYLLEYNPLLLPTIFENAFLIDKTIKTYVLKERKGM